MTRKGDEGRGGDPHDKRRRSIVSRFRTLAGAATWRTRPIDVSAFASMQVMAWRSAGCGTNPTLSIQPEMSDDLDVWVNAGSAISPAADTESTATVELSRRWLRFGLSVAGTSPVLSLCVDADFVPRHA